MGRKIFGTDGVRGKANVGPMTPDVIMKLAIATGKQFTRGDHRHIVVIGKDTRLSGYMIEPALTAGFIAAGMDVVLVGPLPTPAIAMLTRSLRADLGVMISASHNPYEDNGIKFFGPDGYKLSDDVERQIEATVLNNNINDHLATSTNIGQARRMEDAPGRYIEYIKNSFPKNISLEGLKIVIDCAHGAAYRVARQVFWELGADVITIGNEPNGRNINLDCGATNPETIKQAVLKNKADIGIALDGDADRLVICDEKGNILDGDQIMAIVAKNWHESGQLSTNKVVGTIMSNLGLEQYLESLGIELIRAQVGDRYVSALMREHNINLGGEQSGHVIMSDYTTTGDGILAALQVLSLIAKTGKPASEVCNLFTPVPQVLRNMQIGNVNPMDNPELQQTLREKENEIKGNGRLLIRKSGTEPLLRIMAEGLNKPYIEQFVDDIISLIKKFETKAA